MDITASQRPSAAIDLAGYSVTDKFFGRPYIDRDEWRDSPAPHRNVHGGFKNTDTRFTFYFPPHDHYRGRMFQPLEGAHAGHEEAFGGMMGEMLGGLKMMGERLGGYMVESNSGHIGDDVDPRAGDDPTLYGHRANIEVARLSKYVAEQVYGRAPHYCYVWGGSGGGRRSPMCLEYGGDVYAGALPFMSGGNIEPHGTTSRVRSEQPVAFGSMFNVQRLLRHDGKLLRLIDAMQPGGSGDPYAGLTVHERDEVANLYRLGYPRGDEFMIAVPMGQMWLWTSIADMLQEDDADYFDRFWNAPGYVGHDEPQHVLPDLIDVVLPVHRVISARDLIEHADFAGPEFASGRAMAKLMAGSSVGPDTPIAIEVRGIGGGYRLGSGIRIESGAAAGRQLYALNTSGDVFFCDGRREANLKRFHGVKAGDLVRVNNRAFLAFCYYYRYHTSDDPVFDFLRVDGKPLYPQHPVPLASPLMGVPYSGQYEGKLMWVHHTHDSSLWPPQGLLYHRATLGAQGAAATAEKFCIRWTENAEHVPPAFLPSAPNRATNTWLIDYMPVIEQSLRDLCDWVERGIKPLGTNYTFADGKVSLPASARERGGIQPVVTVHANGGARAEVTAGDEVELTLHAELPEGAGNIIAVEWDTAGRGEFVRAEVGSGPSTSIRATLRPRYDAPGTYFATARVTSHRDGRLDATDCRITNVASARVVVG